MAIKRDSVFTVEDYWDGPRAGVASYGGEPHAYKCIFDEGADDWSDRFVLTPISHATLEAVKEAWGIWLRWEAAFRAGATPQATHPALPAERGRYDELRALIDHDIQANVARSFVVRGSFVPSGREPGAIAVHWDAA